MHRSELLLLKSFSTSPDDVDDISHLLLTVLKETLSASFKTVNNQSRTGLIMCKNPLNEGIFL